MENCLGLLKVHMIRGINLAIRDIKSSDPYVIVRMGKQKLKTKTIKKNTNPEWNENLTLYIAIADPFLPVKLQVYDWDMFSMDDKMGDAEIDIKPFIEALTTKENSADGTILNTIKQNRQNCLAEDSCITWKNGKLTQHMFLRLRNVECGEIEIMLEWVDVSGSKGVSSSSSRGPKN